MIVVAYFGSSFESILKGWLECYRLSGNTLPLGMVTDDQTKVPSFWKGDVRIAPIQRPTFATKYGLIKADLLKAQAYECYNQECLVLDIDAFPLVDLSPIANGECVFAMAPNAGIRRYKQWPQMGRELSAGCMRMNSSKIFSTFLKYFNDSDLIAHEWKPHIHGQRCLTLTLREMKGEEIPLEWNTPRLTETTKVYHVGGGNKMLRMKQVIKLLSDKLISNDLLECGSRYSNE